MVKQQDSHSNMVESIPTQPPITWPEPPRPLADSWLDPGIQPFYLFLAFLAALALKRSMR